MPSPSKWKLFKQSQLIANPTPAETILFALLNDEWIFQPIICGFIPDFAHYRALLIIECDGYHHFTHAGHRRDARRTKLLSLKGWKVMRFPNSQITTNPAKVIRLIRLETRRRIV